jgi:hypothetical protein
MKPRSTLSGALLATALCLMPATAFAQDVGEWVLSPYQGSSVLFPGVVESRSGSNITIRFDDGDVETRPASTVRAYNWRVGSQITCRWTDGNWYNATIRSMGSDGYSLQVRYDDDGVMQNTKTGRCRTR